MKLQNLPCRSTFGFLTVLLLALSFFAAPAQSQSPQMTRWGAKITKAEFAETSAPELELPDGWKLCDDEAFTGVNPREYYFTLEAEGANLPAPTVEVHWPDVKISRVYGGSCVQFTEDGVEFKMNSHRAPTSFTSSLPAEGAIHLGIFHSVRGMQAGPYRNLPYPEAQIQAHLNYLFAAREMMRQLGFGDSADSVDGVINLYGFETNFPNGHKDFPPHFHVMLMWDSWNENQACHFILDEKGKILRNDHYVVAHGAAVPEKCTQAPLGSRIDLSDRTGKVRFSLRMLEDGTGLEMTVPGRTRQAMIRSEDAVSSVTCFTRESADAEWVPASKVSVTDDSTRGVLTVTAEKNGKSSSEVWNYDPNTGAITNPQ